MSTQLILYPQNYNGYAFSSTPLLNEYASNITFTSHEISTTDMSSAGLTFAVILLGTHPAQVGNWRLFYSASTTASWNGTSAPSINTNNNLLTLYSAAGGGSYGSANGAYQQVTGLTPGDLYTLTIEHSNLPANSEIWIGAKGAGGWFNLTGTVIGTVGNNQTVISAAGTTTTTYDFTAAQANMVIWFTYVNNTAQTITISKVSLTENAATVPVLATDPTDGQVLCDLYQQEDIPLTLSIDNFKNAAEKTQSYSKSFDLPATKRNNKIFTHIFDVQKIINDVYDFNPYIKTKAVLKQDGLLIFEGSLRLIEIKDDNGEISYNVNLFSETIALKDSLEGKTFAQLNLAELNHEYQYTNITLSWEGEINLINNLAADSFALVPGLATNKTNVIKYPFCDWTGTIDCTQIEPELSRLEDAFRPWISVKYLLDNIARDAGYTFKSEFFDSDDFAKLYMDFNWGAEGGPNDFTHTGSAYYHPGHGTTYAGTSATQFVFVHDGSPDDFDADTGWDLPTSKFVCQNTNTYYKLTAECWFTNNTGSTANINYIRWVRKNVSGDFGGGATYSYFEEQTNITCSPGIPEIWVGILNPGIPLGLNDELYIEWECDTANAVKQENTDFLKRSYISGRVYNNGEFVTSTMFNTKRGELGQWDFLKGIMTMFNLISMPDPTNSNIIIFEPYSDMFVTDTSGTTLSERSIKHDWTDKIDISKIDLKPMDLKREVIFKYVLDEEDYALNKYKVAAQGFEYGSKVLNGSTAIVSSNQVTNLVGIEEVIAEPFSATIIKPIQDVFPNFIIPVIYGADGEVDFGPIDNAPRILYNNGKVSGSYDIPGQNGLPGGIKSEYLQFSHFNPTIPADNTSYDYNFGECGLFPNVTVGGLQPVNNLYNIYHAPYFDELYNVNTRIMTAKVYLNAADINTFDFRDKVMIKNKVYRVNKIDYKPGALSTVEFILLP